MKHTFLAIAFAVATLSACHSTKTVTTTTDSKKAVVPVKVCPAKKACAKKA